MTQETLGPGIVTADPTLFIVTCWGLSALVLGGLVLHAFVTDRRWK